jgi:hypothetical protein
MLNGLLRGHLTTCKLKILKPFFTCGNTSSCSGKQASTFSKCKQIKDTNGTVSGAVVALHEITECKKAEQLLVF